MTPRRNRSRDRLRALLHQRFSEGPHNVLSEMRRAHGRPPRAREKADSGDILQTLLQRGLHSAFRGLGAGGNGGGMDMDNLVAGALMQGPRTMSVMRTIFNLVPNLIGR